MPVRMPPLSMLRTFEVAARHGNFSKAADELHVTHGAVSHQLKSLEDTLGVPLFRREWRGVALTPQGTSLAAAMREAMASIVRGLEAIQNEPARALTVSVLPAFATHWLIPRLGDFQARHPEIEINIRAGQELVDFSREDVDLAVRYGPGAWPGLVATPLMEERIFPVCTPKFARRYRIHDLQSLGEAPLLHSPSEPWKTWFRAVGGTPPLRLRGPSFSETGLLLRAALDGIGVALAREVLVQPDLEAGRLVRPVPHSAPGEFAYFIVHSAQVPPSQRLEAFRDWLLAQAAADARRARATASRPPAGTARPGRASAAGDKR